MVGAMSRLSTRAGTLMPSNIATTPGLNPVPIIVMDAPPPVDPVAGEIVVTDGGITTGGGAPGEGADGEHAGVIPTIARRLAMTVRERNRLFITAPMSAPSEDFNATAHRRTS